MSRVLPHSLEAERSVIGGVLLHHQAYPQVVATVGPGDFGRQT